ncbi:hypothetical protein [Rhizobium leguminosarum]|uniref:hypothetical protein n=1 Tax=Rhizobium johnstonii TaxID=3019933 RepID=UPI001FEF105A|nr:hypothetical protein [Rhizobium leguminosarum]
MITFRNIITAGVVALTFAATSLTATTPALAHGGGGHGDGGFSRDGGHFGGGAHTGGGNFADRGFGAHHFGGAGHFGGHRDGRFAFHDRNRLFFGDDDYDPEQCQPEWLNRYGHRVLVEVCS